MDREQALALLNEYSFADASWSVHCLRVGAASRHLAALLSQRGHPVDVDNAEVLGLLHDLGRSQAHSLRHGVEGYLLARSEGYEREGRICLLHILKGRSLEDGVDLGMLTEEERSLLAADDWSSEALSLEEKIAILADALMSDTGLVPVEQKYASARDRYGARLHHHQDEAWVTELAEEISERLGMHPYDALKELNDDLP